MEENEELVDLISLLHTSNLMSYKNSLLEQGADDVDQLVGLTGEEFQQLCSMIGMDKKPFHVMRFKKALENLSKSPQKLLNSSPPSTDISEQPNDKTSVTDQSASTMPTKGPPPLLKTTPEEPTQHSPAHEQAIAQPTGEHSNFSLLVDHQTPVQLALGPCFCTPAAWDPKRKEIIRRSSMLCPTDDSKTKSLTMYEQSINEAAYQLCLRDPTLLVRRDELFVLSRRAVDPSCRPQHTRQGESVVMKRPVGGVSTPKDTLAYKTVIGKGALKEPSKKRALEVSSKAPLPKRSHADLSMRLSMKERESRMKTLQAEIEANKAFQNVKMIALDEARERGDFSSTAALTAHVKMLKEELCELERAYGILKRKENRSNRYFRGKARGASAQSRTGSSSSLTESLSPVSLVSTEFSPQLSIPPGPMLFETGSDSEVRVSKQETLSPLRSEEQPVADPLQSDEEQPS